MLSGNEGDIGVDRQSSSETPNHFLEAIVGRVTVEGRREFGEMSVASHAGQRPEARHENFTVEGMDNVDNWSAASDLGRSRRHRVRSERWFTTGRGCRDDK